MNKQTFEQNDLFYTKNIVDPLFNNIWLIGSKKTKNAILLDAPPDINNIKKFLINNNQWNINTIFITHNHYDHIDGLKDIISFLNKEIIIWIGINDSDKLKELKINPKYIKYYENSKQYKLNQTIIQFISTPGHTPGSTCILIEDNLFSGDTLFPGGPGRTQDSKSFKILIDNIEKKLLNLSEHIIVHPGHGNDTTIKNSLNEFQIFKSKNLNIDNLSGNITWQ
tara:strand:+ start:199 stop:870 length:672 start_codon:yes stop_codon:yes gene_type:complete